MARIVRRILWWPFYGAALIAFGIATIACLIAGTAFGIAGTIKGLGDGR